MFKQFKRPSFKTAGFIFLSVFLFMSPSTVMADEDEPTLREKKTEEGFIVNLKELIKRSKKKMEKVDERLEEQAREKRNMEREEKAREYYEKAMRLYDDGKYEEAKELWEKAIKITEHPEMEGYIRKSVKRDKKKEKALREAEKRRLKRLEVERGFSAKEVEKTYKEAVEKYKKEEYLAAKLKFEEVEDMFPDHKATRSYLKLIQQLIDEDQQDRIDDALRKEVFASSKQRKEAWKKELERKEKERQRQLAAQAELVYQEAVNLYKDKKYELAKDRFKEVEWILPDYKKTIKYLKKLDEEIAEKGVEYTDEERVKYFARQLKDEKLIEQPQPSEAELARRADELRKEKEKRRKEEAEFVYDAARTLYKKKYYMQAYERFLEVETIYPDYKKTGRYLKRIRKKSPEVAAAYPKDRLAAVNLKEETPKFGDTLVEQASKERLQKLAEEAETKYAQAMSFYKSKNFVEAKRKFIAVEALFPDYKQTRNYLSRIDEDIARVQPGGIEPTPVMAKDEAVALPEPTDAKGLYAQAMEYYKDERYMKAQEAFNKVNQMSPGYRSTERYLKRIENKIEERLVYQKEREEELEEFAIEYQEEPRDAASGGAIEYAASEYEEEINLEDVSRKEKRALKKQQEEIREHVQEENRKQKRELKDVVRETYREGQELYKKRQYVRARAKFAAVERLYPGFKSAKRYVKKINKILGEPEGTSGEEAELAKQEAKPVKIEKPDVMSEDDYEYLLSEEHAEDEQLREFAKEERLKRLEREEQEKKEQMEELARIKEEEKEYERILKQEEEEYKKKEIARLKKKVDEVYGEMVKQYRDGNVQVGEAKEEEAMRLLRTSDFSQKYKKAMRRKLDKEVRRIKKKLDQQRRKEEELALKRKEQRVGDEIKINIKRERELEELEKRIRMEEAKLEREKKAEQERLAKLSEKLMVPVGGDDQMSFATAKKQADMTPKELDRAQRQKIEELERLVEMRREKLRRERERIQEEFQESLEHLYKKGVKLYRKGHDRQAVQIFREVQQMQPGYKKTDKYLAKLGYKPGALMPPINSMYPSHAQGPAGTVTPPSKRGRLEAIRDALDSFEEKLW